MIHKAFSYKRQTRVKFSLIRVLFPLLLTDKLSKIKLAIRQFSPYYLEINASIGFISNIIGMSSGHCPRC